MSEPIDLPPQLRRYVDGIASGSKLQARALARWMAATDERYRSFAEGVCNDLTGALFAGDHERGVRAYLGLCQEINQEQFHFKKHGSYQTSSAGAAFDEVYANEERMADYVVGLLLSYLFWPNHYKLIAF